MSAGLEIAGNSGNLLLPKNTCNVHSKNIKKDIADIAKLVFGCFGGPCWISMNFKGVVVTALKSMTRQAGSMSITMMELNGLSSNGTTERFLESITFEGIEELKLKLKQWWYHGYPENTARKLAFIFRVSQGLAPRIIFYPRGGKMPMVAALPKRLLVFQSDQIYSTMSVAVLLHWEITNGWKSVILVHEVSFLGPILCGRSFLHIQKSDLQISCCTTSAYVILCPNLVPDAYHLYPCVNSGNHWWFIIYSVSLRQITKSYQILVRKIKSKYLKHHQKININHLDPFGFQHVPTCSNSSLGRSQWCVPHQNHHRGARPTAPGGPHLADQVAGATLSFGRLASGAWAEPWTREIKYIHSTS